MSIAKSWPFEEARKLLKRVEGKSCVVFETGYGPSGAAHIGTLCEVVRTNMVRNAFEELTEGKVDTRLIAFSDDYDGFRRVPEGMPESMTNDLGKPLTSVRDPFGEYASFAERNNIGLQHFIDETGIGYQFMSATQCYKSGLFDETLLKVLENYEEVCEIMLPTFGEARRGTYSPFMPISPLTGNVLAEGVIGIDKACQILFAKDENGDTFTTKVTGGAVKCQWKIDWALRWAALGVDYEMHGKDLLDSAALSTRIVKAIGGKVPTTYFYELFLDDEGRKQSKSLGNGMSLEEWMRYSSSAPLRHFMFQSPKSAKAFTPTIVPRITDEYLKALSVYPSLEDTARLDSPVWHIHEGSPPTFESDVSFSLLLNLANVSKAKDSATLLNYLDQYKAISSHDRETIEQMVPGVIAYAQEQVESKVCRAPSELEANAFNALADQLELMEDDLSGEAYQFYVYEIGKQFGFDPLRSWFQAIYEVMFGDSQGPRFGSFIAAYGRVRSIELIRHAAQQYNA